MGSIRLFLAFAVLASHAEVLGFEILPGDTAVTAFFVISGFYMSLILTGRYAGRPKSVFYANRVLRLYPTYLIALAAQVLVLMIWDMHPFTTRDTVLFAYAEGDMVPLTHLLTNVFVFGQEVLYWLGLDIRGGVYFWNVPEGCVLSGFTLSMLPQAWAIAVEFYFYLLAPFLVFRRSILLVDLLAASLLLRLVIHAASPEYDEFMQRFLPTQLYLFLAGMLSFRIYERIKDRNMTARIGWVLLPALVAFIFGYDRMGVNGDALFVGLVAAALPFVFRLSRSSGLDRFLGRVSYPFYLLHFLVLTVYEETAVDYRPWVLVLLLFASSVIVLSAVEYPIDRFRRRRYGTGEVLPPPAPPVSPRTLAA